jgi:stage V sporulation protein B
MNIIFIYLTKGSADYMGRLIIDTAFLAFAHFVGGAISFIYRLYLSQNLGPEGMGAYQQTLAFYGTAVTLTTAGIPFAVSRLIAEYKQKKKQQQIFGTTLALTAFFSGIGSLFVLILWAVSGQRALLLILPAAVFVGFSSIFKGFYLGNQNLSPVWRSIIAECICRALLGITFVKSSLFVQVEGPTRGAITALALGEAVSLVVMLSYFKNTRIRIKPTGGNFVQALEILSIAIPVSLSHFINSVSGSLEAVLVPKSLNVSGLMHSDALAIYGKTAGMVIPLLGFPALFTISLSSNLIPRIAKSLSTKDTNHAFILAEQAISITFLFSFGVSAFFIVLAEPIGEMLFYGFSLKELIRGFAVGIPLFYAETVLMALLRGCGNNLTPLVISVLCLIITNSIICIAATKPFLGIYGYSIALITASAVSVVIGIYSLEKRFNKKFNTLNILLKPIICSCFLAYILNSCHIHLKSLLCHDFFRITACFLIGASGFLLMAKILGVIPSNQSNAR